MSESNLDILITRVIDRRAGSTDWQELEALGAANPSVWRDLALAQKDDSALRVAVEDAVAPACSMPLVPAQHAETRMRLRMGRSLMWSGWAAAAAVVLAVFAGRTGPATNEPQPQVAGVALPQVLNDYINRGKAAGTVIGELPTKVLLDSRKTEDGQTEVTFLRQIIERVRVNDLYRATVDEAGNPQPLRIDLQPVEAGDRSAT